MQPFQPINPRQPWIDSTSLLKRNQLGYTPPSAHEPEQPAAPQDSVNLSKDKDKSAKEREERERNQKTYRRPTFPTPPMPMPRQAGGGGFMLSKNQPPPSEKPMKEKDLPSYGRWSGQPAPEPWEDLLLEAEWSCPDYIEPLLADPPDRPGRLKLAWLLCHFGPGIVRRCIDFGLTVCLGTEFSQVEQTLMIESGAPAQIVFEAFARAYDQALGDGTCASLSYLAVLSNYHQCRAKGPHWTGPDHFFAQQLAAFLSKQPLASAPMAGYAAPAPRSPDTCTVRGTG